MRPMLASASFLLLLFILPFPGTVALRLLCLAISFGVAVACWRKLNPPNFPGKAYVVSWIALAALSLSYAVDPAYSLGEIKNEIGYTMMALTAFYVYFDNKGKALLAAWALVWSLAAISAWSLWFWASPDDWKDDPGFGGVGAYVGLVLMVVPAMLLIWQWQPRSRWLLYLIAFVALLAAAYSRQRIFWPALGMELAVLVMLLRFQNGMALSTRRSAVFLAVIVGAGLIFMLATQSARFGMHGGKVEIGNDPRLQHWPAVVTRIGEHPLVGVGFGRNAMKLGHPDLVPADTPLFWHAHNVFLNYGIAMGIPGIFALFALFAGLAASYWRMYRSEDQALTILGIAGILLLTSVLLRNLSNDFFQRDVSLLFWSMNGLFLGVGRRLQSRYHPEEGS